MGVSCAQIVEKFPGLVRFVKGSEQANATLPCSSKAPKASGLTFCPEAQDLEGLLQSQVSIIVTTPQLAEKVGPLPSDKAVLASAQLQLAMALINSEFFPVQKDRQPIAGPRLHPTAVIAPSAQVHETAIVGPHSVIAEGVKIGAHVVIGPNSTIEADTIIGEGTHIHGQVFIGRDVEIGCRCIVKPQSAIGTDGYGYATDEKGRHFKKPHYGKVIIHDDVHIGSGVYIDRGTFEDAIIGEGTKIDNYCHFGHNVQIGKHCLITAGMITAGSVKIGNHCVFGGRTTIAGHLEVCDGVQVAGLSGIPNDVKVPGRYGGYPLMPLNQSLKVHATFVHLVEMRKNISRVLKKLGLTDGAEA